MVNKVELTDGFILLRPYQLSDVERLYEAASESIPEVSVWMEWCHPGYVIEESHEFVAKQDSAWGQGTDYNFTIVDPSDDSYLGGCGINQLSKNRSANLGYWVRTSRTKQGVATAATRLLALFGFEELGLQRIELTVAIANRASQRVAEKAGATREGILRNRLFYYDRPHDVVMFSLIPQDLL
ncbi:MAG: GNAT family N-acetyltransferase [Chloroflexi bacterium]|nr:GNAT family N-acetyltransferase [Chloroflexota bacterium]